MALKDLLTCRAELHPILLQTLLHSRVIAHLLSAKARGISGASLLLLWAALMSALGKTCGAADKKQGYDQNCISHFVTPVRKTPVLSSSDPIFDNSGTSGMFRRPV
jgi:hypothetical protein